MIDSKNQQIMQYLNSNVDLNTINRVQDELSSVKNVNAAQKEGENELNKLKQQLESFKGLYKISEAKELAKQLFHIRNEISYIKAGNARCTIISRANTFKIILDADKEVIVYSFNKNEV